MEKEKSNPKADRRPEEAKRSKLHNHRGREKEKKKRQPNPQPLKSGEATPFGYRTKIDTGTRNESRTNEGPKRED